MDLTVALQMCARASRGMGFEPGVETPAFMAKLGYDVNESQMWPGIQEVNSIYLKMLLSDVRSLHCAFTLSLQTVSL